MPWKTNILHAATKASDHKNIIKTWQRHGSAQYPEPAQLNGKAQIGKCNMSFMFILIYKNIRITRLKSVILSLAVAGCTCLGEDTGAQNKQ